MRRILFPIYLVALIFLFDRLIKHYLIKNVVWEQRLFGLGPIDFGFYKNTGVAFSINLPANLILVLTAAIIAGLFVWLYFSITSHPERLLPLVLIIDGAISNLIDRLRYGFVVDYINLKIWPIFNLADVMIVAGVGLLLYSEVVRNKKV